MSRDLASLLKGSKNYDTWLAIGENRIADALQTLGGVSAKEKKTFFDFWKKKVTDPALDPAQQVAREFLSGKPEPLLVAPSSRLEEAGEHFPEWIRFCCVVQSNGHYQQATKILLQETLGWLGRLAEEVSEKAGDYPRTAIAGYVWMNGAIIREWCEPLAKFFEQRLDLAGKANTLQLKCKITGAIMAHYPQTLGPDMIVAASALEAVGEIEIPKGYYQAIITDFQPIADDIRAAPEEPVTEDDILTLEALRDAYEGLNRLDGTEAFQDEQTFLMTIIYRGVTAEPAVPHNPLQ